MILDRGVCFCFIGQSILPMARGKWALARGHKSAQLIADMDSTCLYGFSPLSSSALSYTVHAGKTSVHSVCLKLCQKNLLFHNFFFWTWQAYNVCSSKGHLRSYKIWWALPHSQGSSRPSPKLLHPAHIETSYSFIKITHIVARVSSFSFITFRTNVAFCSLKNNRRSFCMESSQWDWCRDLVRAGLGRRQRAICRLPSIKFQCY